MCGTIKPDWGAAARDYGFYDVKGVAEQLVERLGITRTVIEPVRDVGFLHPGRGAALLKKGQRLCWFGELHPALAKELDVQKRVYVLEMPVSGLVVDQAETPTYRELPRTPSIRRDIAVVAGSEVAAQDLERTIRSAGGNLLTAVRLFDLYEGEHIEAGKRSLAFSLTFRDPNPEKTLTDDQASAACEKIVKSLGEAHGASLR
jgi:phenylalanyl-tRNA synthetase beta chain